MASINGATDKQRRKYRNYREAKRTETVDTNMR